MNQSKQYKWILDQIEDSKIDAAEWAAEAGASAAAKFKEIYKAGRDVIELEIEDLAQTLVPDDMPSVRLAHFTKVVDLAAHIEERTDRVLYGGLIAKAAGKSISKVDVVACITKERRAIKEVRVADEKLKAGDNKEAIMRDFIIPPPETPRAESTTPTPPAAPPPPGATPPNPNAPAAPPPPGKKKSSEHKRYADARDTVMKSVALKVPEERLGQFVSQIILKSMGFTAFKTLTELYLVRGSERIAVDLSSRGSFPQILFQASGLSPRKGSHSGYIAAVVYFLTLSATKAREVSWSYLSRGGAVYFPTGDLSGTILKIEPGRVTKVKMADVRVPAVAGSEFRPFTYTEKPGGIARIDKLLRWTSLSEFGRLFLRSWLSALPILPKIGVVPIVRIQGGSSSGKTRTVNAVSFLVNGAQCSSVPTAAALISRLAVQMLTIDDNRETGDMSPDFLGTLLQATHLGAREKRSKNSDTGTVVERISGALLMTGIEPIHDGKSELASRMITLNCSNRYRLPDSPVSEIVLTNAILEARDDFWSESVRMCAIAIELDRQHGERLGAEIEKIFGATRIGRLSAFLRIMYLVWVAGLPLEDQGPALKAVAEPWRKTFQEISGASLRSLVDEELSVSVLRHLFHYGRSVALPVAPESAQVSALDGKFNMDLADGIAYLGPMRATQLARFARKAGKELNAPKAITYSLRAGQLECRLLDGIAFMKAAGFSVHIEVTRKGVNRFSFMQEKPPSEEEPPSKPPPKVPPKVPPKAPSGPNELWDH